jgi:nucleotide-binding universal stress UspA family protein
MSQVQRILVPTDFSETSDLATDYAIDMAFRYGASIRFIHALDDLNYLAVYPEGYVDVPSLRIHLEIEAQERLGALVKRCKANHVEAEGIVLSGRPAGVIVDEAAAHQIDLVVMGTHGRTGVAHMVMGSVAERVVRIAPCPVLTVRSNVQRAVKVAADATARHQPMADARL